ncbi:MAG: 30S ribosome-binding factor RbfA [Desulfobacterales bacterium]|nr:30S ribosome-binding factor RbfA [Desulfobacterales bacterium]
MKPFTRADRVGQLIQQTLSEILFKHISDPRLKMVTITGVDMSPDLRLARIYFTVSGGKSSRDKALQGFKKALGYLKRSLGQQLDLRYMPELKFFYDESFDYGEHIDKVLNTLSEK